MRARYNRISTANQKLDRQLAKEHKGELVFNDVISGAVPFEKRPEAIKLIEEIKTGKVDYVSVSSIDRLGRNLMDVLVTVQLFTNNGINLMVDNLGTTSLVPDELNGGLKPNGTFKLIVSVMANIAEMERETMLERQREGVAIAKAKGKYKGRLRGSKESDSEVLTKYPEVAKELRSGVISLRKIGKIYKVSLGTVQKVKSLL